MTFFLHSRVMSDQAVSNLGQRRRRPRLMRRGERCEEACARAARPAVMVTETPDLVGNPGDLGVWFARLSLPLVRPSSTTGGLYSASALAKVLFDQCKLPDPWSKI